jgi:hypothetical protein
VAHQLSIRFDDVLGLLRSGLLQEVEAQYAAHLGLPVSQAWGDSQKLTKQLASTGITRSHLEAILASSRSELFALADAISAVADDREEWAPGEEPDADESHTDGVHVAVGRGFSLSVACTLWLLRHRQHSDLVAWFKACRIPFHRDHASKVREAYRRVQDAGKAG